MTEEQKRTLLASVIEDDARKMLPIIETLKAHLIKIIDPSISDDQVIDRAHAVLLRIESLSTRATRYCNFSQVLMRPGVGIGGLIANVGSDNVS